MLESTLRSKTDGTATIRGAVAETHVVCPMALLLIRIDTELIANQGKTV